MSTNNQIRPEHNPDTFSTSIMQKFDDGEGLPLDDPEGLSRERRGRPGETQQHAVDEEKTPPSAG